MTYANPFLRLVFGGPLFTVEEWSCSLALIEEEPGGEHPAYPETVPQGVIDAVTAFIVSGLISSDAKLGWIKLNPIGTDGRYMTNQTVRWDDATPAAGTGNTGYIPQTALVVSLQTGFARGYAHSGRFYLPVPDVYPAADGVVAEATITPYVTAATTFLEALNTALTGFRVGVVSNVGTGAEREVTNVRVGRVLDTMRSRRTKIPETYAIGATLAGA